MADKRIDQLTAATTMGDDDLLVLQQNNQAKKLSGATLSDYIYDVVEVSNTEPTESRNKVWIKPSSEDLELAEMSDVDEIKTALDCFTNNNLVTLEFSQGAISSTTGQNSSSSTRVRTGLFYYAPLGFSIAIPDGYKMYWFSYTSNTMDSFVESHGWITDSIVTTNKINGNYVHFVFAKTNDSAITPETVYSPINATFYTPTDKTLLNENKPADAKATGDIARNSLTLSKDYASAVPNNTNYDTLTTPGNYVVVSNSAASSMVNCPTTLAHRLFVITSTSATRILQIVIHNSLDRPFTYIRFYNGTNWGDWGRISTDQTSPSSMGYISTDQDLNELQDNGIYRFTSSVVLANSPSRINDGAILVVFYPEVNRTYDSALQFLTYADGAAYFRRKATAEWLPWIRIVTEKEGRGIAVNVALDGIETKQISSAGNWLNSGGQSKSYAVSIPTGVNKVSLVGVKSGVVAFLHSLTGYDSDISTTADMSKQYKNRIVFADSGYAEYRISSDDVKYLYILTHGSSSGADFTPTNVFFHYDYIPEKLQELPVLYLSGDTSTMTKDNAVTLDYSFFGQTGTCTVKWQGSSSQRYVKKNYTIKFDTAFDGWNKWATFVNDLRSANGNISTIPTTSRWGNQTKFCTKANWVDPSAARNIVCARLWGQIVASRVTAGDVTDNRKDSPNYGAINGFPIEIIINNETAGLYTFNIPKDGWMFAMGEGQAEYVLAAEDNSKNACKWKATALVDGTDYSVEYAPDGVSDATIATSLNTAITAAINAGSDWETALAPYLDIDSVIDYFIFTCCVNNHDALARNIVYGTYDGVKWFMSAYDLDTTFGVDPYGTSWFDVVNDRNQFAEAAQMHRLAELMYTYSKTKLKARYQELRSGILSEVNVWKELSNFIVDIPTRDYDIDRNRWPSMPGTATANMAQYMEYYRMHCTYLDDEVAALS